MERSQQTSRLPAGTRLARYQIVHQLGAGGMGEVYRARDEQLDRDVAIKVLPVSSFDDPAARARLVREAKAAAALNHPNVCTVYEVGEADGQAYIAMELVEGMTLSAMVVAGPLPIDQVLRYGRQLADALTHAHERGVVHRDLKSNNAIVTPDGRVKVLDFGLAKRSVDADLTAAVTQIHASLTMPGTAVGTLAYMSPEQLRGKGVHLSSDIWALGVVLYEMAAGARPFTGRTTFELSAAILNDAPLPLPPQVPPPLAAVIERCLAKDEGRYTTAADVRTALDLMQASGESAQSVVPPVAAPASSTRDGTAVYSAPRPIVSRRLALLAAAALVVVASGITVWRLAPWQGPGRTVAVLPFENRGRDEDLQYLCEGIAESLIRKIRALQSLRVNNLGSVLPYQKGPIDPVQVGRQLGVESILAGALELKGTRLVLSTQLVDVATGRQLWTKTYDRPAEDLLNVQDDIARAIFDDGLRVRLTDDERQQLVRHPTTDGDAYDLYLQARFLQRRATEDDYLYSRELLERAIVRDPMFALAYAALGGNYAMMVTDGLVRPSDAWPQVSRYMRQARDIDPNLVELHAFEHARAFLFDWDWEGAERARSRVLQSPVGDFDPQVLRAIATELWAVGRLDEALRLARRTRELDPRSAYLAVLEADYLLRDGQLDAAIALYERAVQTDPDIANTYFGLAEARARQGRFDDALEARRKAHTVAGDEGLAEVLKTARGEAGYRRLEQAWQRLQLASLEARAATDYVSPLDFARIYAQLGDKELTFKYLEAAFVDRSPGLVFLKVDPAWEAVRNDARFQDAVRRVGLP
jgi:TolB-like protein